VHRGAPAVLFIRGGWRRHSAMGNTRLNRGDCGCAPRLQVAYLLWKDGCSAEGGAAIRSARLAPGLTLKQCVFDDTHSGSDAGVQAALSGSTQAPARSAGTGAPQWPACAPPGVGTLPIASDGALRPIAPPSARAHRHACSAGLPGDRAWRQRASGFSSPDSPASGTSGAQGRKRSCARCATRPRSDRSAPWLWPGSTSRCLRTTFRTT
jgi:hypothetical protein